MRKDDLVAIYEDLRDLGFSVEQDVIEKVIDAYQDWRLSTLATNGTVDDGQVVMGLAFHEESPRNNADILLSPTVRLWVNLTDEFKHDALLRVFEDEWLQPWIRTNHDSAEIENSR